MTRELKTLMEDATTRPQPFTPDVDKLVTAGRRRVRVHRALVSAAAVAVVATAVVAASVGGLRDLRGAPDPAASPTSTVSQQAAYTDLCAKSDDFFRTANDDVWRRRVVATWTAKVVEVSDPDGRITVRRSPDGTQYAYCVAGVPIWGKSLGGFGSTLLNVGIVTRQYQIQRYWSMGCGNDPNVDRATMPRQCRGVRYSYAGRVPEGVTRIAFRGLGQQADATIKDGYWAYRIYTGNITDGNADPIWITMYNASGAEVFTQRYG